MLTSSGLEERVREAVSLLDAIDVGRLLGPRPGRPERRVKSEAALALVQVARKRLVDGLEAGAAR